MDQQDVGTQPHRRRTPAALVGVLWYWGALAVAAGLGAGNLSKLWPAWPLGFIAAGIWGLNLLLLVYGVGRPLSIGSVPFLAVASASRLQSLGLGTIGQ